MCASLEVIDDNVVEVNEESLILSLSANDPPVTRITASSCTVVIRENDNDGNFIFYSLLQLRHHDIF